MRSCDLLIAGQGLAGTTLAWRALQRGLDIVVIDDAQPITASKIAAGLMTPVTSSKLKVQRDFAMLSETARAHYREIENRCQTTLLTARPALRRLRDERELSAWQSADDDLLRWLVAYREKHPFIKAQGDTIVAMPAAARLDINAYLNTSRRAFETLGILINGSLRAGQVASAEHGVNIAGHNIRARYLTFCRGHNDHDNPWFNALGWRPAKGQMLTLRCTTLGREHTLHGNGIWITPTRQDLFLAGASYEWDRLDTIPTADVRDTLSKAVSALIDAPFDIIDQQAAVRPIVQGRMPVIGRSAESRITLFNGLGSKGALFAPYVAGALLDHLLSDAPIDTRLCLARRSTS